MSHQCRRSPPPSRTSSCTAARAHPCYRRRLDLLGPSWPSTAARALGRHRRHLSFSGTSDVATTSMNAWIFLRHRRHSSSSSTSVAAMTDVDAWIVSSCRRGPPPPLEHAHAHLPRPQLERTLTVLLCRHILQLKEVGVVYCCRRREEWTEPARRRRAGGGSRRMCRSSCGAHPWRRNPTGLWDPP
jgi:hypothetical protein